MAQDWITREISSGLQKLILVNLDHAPAFDVLSKGTLPAWVEAITNGRVYDEVVDAPRFREAFRKLMAQSTSWPKPKQFLEAMPLTAKFRAPTPIEDEARRELGMRKLTEIARKMGFPMPGDPQP